MRDLCRQRGVELLEGHLMPDHVHMCLRMPPKFGITFVIGFLKGKSAVRIQRRVGNKRVMDFVSAVFRVMPHANEQERFKRIAEQMQSVKLVSLSEYRDDKAKPVDEIIFPQVGERDADIFENNLLEVMQFVFNHTTFDDDNELDRELLKVYKPLGVIPSRQFDPAQVATIDGSALRKVVDRIVPEDMAKATDPDFKQKSLTGLFQPKGKMPLELLFLHSVIGPIGLPASEAMYPAIGTNDGKPINGMHDYVIRMSQDELQPAQAFWSVTLYDLKNGFFIPNDKKKYSVGKNGGMKLNDDGGIEIFISAENPDSVSEENWLPITRKDENMDIVMRIYVPDMEKIKAWTAPLAKRLQ